MEIEPGLWPESSEKGSFPIIRRRLSAISVRDAENRSTETVGWFAKACHGGVAVVLETVHVML